VSGAAEIVVVGAGCVGASVAYRLAQRGARVTVLDQAAPGGGTSSASFAWTNSFNKTPRDYHDLNVASMEEHAALAKELPGGGWLHPEGALAWEDSAAGRARLEQAIARLDGWGYPIERITPAQAREIEPDLHIAPTVATVVWTPGEGYLEAVPYVGAVLAAARRHGARVLGGRRVVEILRAGDRVLGVRTEDGERFEAQAVVDCAGIAAGEIAGLAGLALPLDRVPGRLVYTAPVATTLRRPIHAPGVHFRPDGGGRIVLAEGAHDQVWRESAEAWPAERSLAVAAIHLPAPSCSTGSPTRAWLPTAPLASSEPSLAGEVGGMTGRR
jgi:glycine/D-amino acid oxidase-like deaminating enzyme